MIRPRTRWRAAPWQLYALALPALLRPPLTLTRAQVSGVESSATGADGATLNLFGADVARFEGTARRLLIEGQRTNLLTGQDAPVTQNVTVAAAVHTLSFWGTGSITLSGVHAATLSGTGANNRVTLSFTPTAGTLTVTVSGTVTRAQLEAGAFASSYVRSSSGQATRGADIVTATLASLGVGTGGPITVLVAGRLNESTAAFPRVVEINDNSGNNVVGIWPQTGTTQLDLRVFRSSVETAAAIGSFTYGQMFRVGFSIDAAGRAIASNGATLSNALTGAVVPHTDIDLGNRADGARPMHGEILALRVLPYVLSDTDLAAAVAAMPT
jgi:hypothetical protein